MSAYYGLAVAGMAIVLGMSKRGSFAGPPELKKVKVGGDVELHGRHTPVHVDHGFTYDLPSFKGWAAVDTSKAFPTNGEDRFSLVHLKSKTPFSYGLKLRDALGLVLVIEQLQPGLGRKPSISSSELKAIWQKLEHTQDDDLSHALRAEVGPTLTWTSRARRRAPYKADRGHPDYLYDSDEPYWIGFDDLNVWRMASKAVSTENAIEKDGHIFATHSDNGTWKVSNNSDPSLADIMVKMEKIQELTHIPRSKMIVLKGKRRMHTDRNLLVRVPADVVERARRRYQVDVVNDPSAFRDGPYFRRF
jgi:hypothetical protein